MKRVNRLGHEAEVANQFIGEAREITVDITNWELRLHDGTTPGGWKILNRDQNDARYQARSVELDGFLNWEPNERGLVTRLGPSNYVLRGLEVNNENLTVQNWNAYAGNPYLSLAPTITSDHVTDGVWTFNEAIQAEGGVVGDLTGNTFGHHTGNSTGDVEGNLTGNAHGSHTGSFTGNLDTEGFTLNMGDGQVKKEWVENFDYWLERFGVPIGGIMMFSGGVGDIPDNWALCDGTNGTPNLSDKFIMGAGTTYGIGSSGGSTKHKHEVETELGGKHTHAATGGETALTISQIPSHKHANGVTDSGTDVFSRGTTPSAISTPDSIDNNSNNGTIEGWTSDVGGGDPHSHTVTVSEAGNHKHVGTTSETVFLPPYYALALIMRIQ